ncbi:hypothetical protein BD289DRAFT_104460 [Coniella lustricola]|uniref:Uncharacterized protein n=1 Tax=Coniella lustricola TaxID=2025994 RepID=A0A2T2ZXZ9_9PEZI|nr:hypothetical protein BD289DRAFT_104460 [Coniella lustricola]
MTIVTTRNIPICVCFCETAHESVQMALCHECVVREKTDLVGRDVQQLKRRNPRETSYWTSSFEDHLLKKARKTAGASARGYWWIVSAEIRSLRVTIYPAPKPRLRPTILLPHAGSHEAAVVLGKDSIAVLLDPSRDGRALFWTPILEIETFLGSLHVNTTVTGTRLNWAAGVPLDLEECQTFWISSLVNMAKLIFCRYI